MDATPIIHYPTAVSGWDAEEADAIKRVIDSDRYTMGEECEAFETEFAAYHSMKYGIGVNSGSSANLISVAAMVHLGHICRGDTIAVPALAWSTTYAPFIQYGMDLRLLDCDNTWNVPATAIKGCSAAVTCSVLGNPQTWVPLGVPALEDNCEAVGARHDNTLTGTGGLANTFSFYYSHQLSAIEGGMILTNDREFAATCRMLRNHGWTRGVVAAKTFDDEYCFAMHGYNVRPVELHSAIARVQLRKLAARIAARTANYSFWLKVSKGLHITHPTIHGAPSFFGIHFCVASREVRAKLAAALRAAGIDCRPPLAGSIRKQPYGSRWAHQRTVNADKIHETGIMIGNPPFDGSALIDRAVRVMREVL